ncbi:DUF1049 domain-containing protein [Streptomyces sp. Tue6028]|uniref:DUF1049 domain-containing protein n=1 Tax=Streptomyces sp. Tue6028 TaxID=2036037 RepID=UPI003D7609DB
MSPKTSESAGGNGGGPASPGRISIAALALITLIFVFENRRSTKIRLLGPEVTMPLWMALLGTGAIGGLCGAYAVRKRRS